MQELYGINYDRDDKNDKGTEMTKMTGNPFYARGPVEPQYFANRSELLQFFVQNVEDAAQNKNTKPDNITILGNWGIGKTSTLLKFQDIIHNEKKDVINVFSVLFPLKPSVCESADVFTSSLLDAISKQYSISIPLKDRIGAVIKEEAKIWEQWKLESISLSPELRRKSNKLDLVDALTRLWGKLENKGIDLVVIMIDDIHYMLTEGWSGSLYDLRTDIQALATGGTKYLFIITGPKFIYPSMHEMAEPFTRLFERFELIKFDLAGTGEAITKPLKIAGIHLELSNDVIAQIHTITDGHPYFIASMMRDILRIHKKETLTLYEFEQIKPILIEHLARTKFEDDYNKATDTEKQILLNCAQLKNKIFSPSEIESKSKSKLFERLTDKELLVKLERGKYSLYHPLFKEYLNNISQI